MGGWERRYSCCSSDGESGGCTVASCHVCDGFDPDELRGFVKTLPHDQEPVDGDYGVYALDCEMCYTTVGLELTRVTVIDRDLNTAYESLVKPENPIIDYNTRYMLFLYLLLGASLSEGIFQAQVSDSSLYVLFATFEHLVLARSYCTITF